MKNCSKCGLFKPLKDFHKNRASRDGHHNQCAECKRARSREWYRTNHEKAMTTQRAYRIRHPDRMKQYRDKNPTYYRDRERRLSQDPAYRAARAERRAIYHRKLKFEVYAKLGDRCNRCGICDPKVLQIDHVNGGGRKELRAIPRAAYLKKILKDSTGYQLLCANCNWLKRWELGEYCSEHDVVRRRNEMFAKPTEGILYQTI